MTNATAAEAGTRIANRVGGLRARPILLVEADDQNRADMEALARALREQGASALTHAALATDHGFSDCRIALQAIVIDWLEKLPT